MPKRVPLRIYRLKRGTGVTGGFTVVPPSSKYLQGIDEGNITTDNQDGKRKIVVTVANLLGVTAGTTIIGGPAFEVQQEGDRLVVVITLSVGGVTAGAQRYNVKRSTPTATDDLPSIFEFYVNPSHVTPVYRKLVSEIRTRGAYEIQHWGEALTELQISGRSGSMHRITGRPQDPGSIGQTLSISEDVTQSTAWQRLNQLKQFYDADHSIKNQEDLVLLGINYYDKFYIGYFTSFTGPEADAQFQYIVNYSFSFKVQAESSVDSFFGGQL